MNTPAVSTNVSRGTMIEARGIVKNFGQTPALRGASLTVRQGEILAIMGPSGSGKSTLLHCLAGIFTPDSGDVMFDGQVVNTMSEADRTKLRRTAFGFVFQFGQLVPELTAADNVALPLLLNRHQAQGGLQDRRHLARQARRRRQGRQADRGAVRRRGAAGRGRPRARDGAEGASSPTSRPGRSTR